MGPRVAAPRQKKIPAGWRGFSKGVKLLLDVDNDAGANGTAAPTKAPLSRVPSCLKMLGGNEFRLRRDFCFAKMLERRFAPPHLRWGPEGGRTTPWQKEIPAIGRGFLKGSKNYSSMSITTPEPTVRPPSRMAKRRPFSMAMGVISSTFMSTLSPGMHISVPSGRVMMPVTSVVRK